MDAVKFLQERNRMYESGAATPSIGLEDDYDPVNAVKIVEEWSAAHPHKTRQSVFLKMFPNVILNDKGQPGFCPRTLDTAYHPAGDCVLDVDICQRCKDKFWMQEVE